MKLFLLFLISIILSFLQHFEALEEHSVPRNSASSASVARLYPPEIAGVLSIDKKLPHHHISTKKVKKINCGVECKRRCKKSSRKNVCHRACKTCCQRCHCVPPGTYGHRGYCPCYARLKTHGGQLKCP